jgi:hypothetical protein
MEDHEILIPVTDYIISTTTTNKKDVCGEQHIIQND